MTKQKTNENIDKIAKMLGVDKMVTPSDIEAILSAIKNVLKSSEDSTFELNKTTAKIVKNMFDDILEKQMQLENRIHDAETKREIKQLQKMSDTLDEVKKLVDYIMENKPKDGESPEFDEDELIEKVVAKTQKTTTKEEVRDLLEKLEGDERLSIEAIKGLEELLNKQVGGNVRIIGRNGGGVQSIVAGSGVTITSSLAKGKGVVTISAAGGSGSGDVVGPASSTDNAIARYDSTTGKIIQNSGVTISDSNVITAVGILLSGLNASQLVATDGSKNLQSLDTATYPSLTELSYTKGVTSSLQIQIDAKLPTSYLDTDVALTANSDAKIPSQKAVKAYVDNAVTGLLDLKGDTDCSTNPNYPSALKGDAYYVTVAGKIGGASGKTVEIGDVYVAKADNAGGAEASVGTSWFVLNQNLSGVALTSGNLSQFAATTSAQLASIISDETGSGALVFANSPTLVTPNLGTPSTLVLTNATGLPVASIVGDTSTALGVGSINVGHATDTTITRVSAGLIAVEGVTVVDVSTAQTLSNKTLTAPKFADLGYIADANGNEMLIFDTVTSAVNEFTIVNAATGNAPQMQASGGDTNIDIKLVPKGTGIVKGELHRFAVRLVEAATDTATGTSIGGDYRISNRAITIKAVGAYVDTAGTTGLMTIDINEAGTTIMSTNKVTLDSTEKSSETAATAPGITDASIAADAIITFDVDGVQTTKAKGLTVWVDYVFT